MPLRALDWYALNSTRSYPLDDAATGVDDAGRPLPTDVLVDICLRYTAPPGRAMIAGVTVTPWIVTVVVVQSPSGPTGPASLTPPPFRPLAAVSLAQPVVPGRCYLVDPTDDGVAGWVVFGNGVTTPGSWRFATARQAGLLPRAARSVPQPGVSSLAGMSGLVQLDPGNDVVVEVETVKVDGKPTQAAVLRLADKQDNDLLRAYAGPCGGRPEEGTCREPAVETVNGVAPDCNGVLNLTIHGGYARELAIGGGFAVDYPIDMNASCAEPDWDGGDSSHACDDPIASSEALTAENLESSYQLQRGWYNAGLPYTADLESGVPHELNAEVGRIASVVAPGTTVSGLGVVDGWLEIRDSSRPTIGQFTVVSGPYNVAVDLANTKITADVGVIDPGDVTERVNVGVVLDLHHAPYINPTELEAFNAPPRRYFLVLANFRDASFELWWFDGTNYRRLTDPELVGLCPLSMGNPHRIQAAMVQSGPAGPVAIEAQLTDLVVGGPPRAAFSVVTDKPSWLRYAPEYGVHGKVGVGTRRSRARIYRFQWEAV